MTKQWSTNLALAWLLSLLVAGVYFIGWPFVIIMGFIGIVVITAVAIAELFDD